MIDWLVASLVGMAPLIGSGIVGGMLVAWIWYLNR